MDEIFDLHVYTNNSPCGSDKVSFLCETAVAKGIRAVAFTDICGLDTMDVFDTKRRMRHAFYDTAKSRQLFFGSLSVFSGIEFEQAVINPEAVSSILAKRDYDIALTSVTRFAGSTEFFPEQRSDSFAVEDFFRRYTDMLKETVERTEFDVLSRPLAPLRNISADFSLFEECMKPVLASLAEREKAFEVDTADIIGSERLRDMYMRLVGYFRSIGGKYITVGSESRCFEQIGSGIELACSAIKRAGFESICFYDKRIPYEVKL